MNVSFIVPAYNVSKTIGRALDSIVEQETSSLDYEIIVVNDGSPDDLDDVVEKYKDKIKYYKKENGGLSDARNYGISKAKGDYLIFVDSDDYISKTLLKDIEKYIEKDVDLIKWSPSIVSDSGEVLKENKVNNYQETTGEEGFNTLFGTDPLLVCVWNYAIKKEIMIEFPVGKYHEDFAVMPLIMLQARTMIITDKTEYFYVQTDSSIMRGNDDEKQRKRAEDILSHFDNLINESGKMNIGQKAKENVGIFGTNALLVIIPDLNENNKRFFIKELKNRKIYKYIKIRNPKQLIKRIVLTIKF